MKILKMSFSKIFAQFFFIYMPIFACAGNLSQIEANKNTTLNSLTFVTRNISSLNTRDKYTQDTQGFLILDNKNLFGSPEKLVFEDGPRTGGGGNACSLSIAQSTKNLITYLNQMTDLLDPFQMDRLIQKIKSARFYLKANLKIGKEIKDAINYPDDGNIVLSPKACRNELIEPTGRAMALLLHEYLGLARIDDRRYSISGTFMDMYTRSQEQKNEITTYLEEEIKKEISGKTSCLNGKIAKKNAEMAENYGGRYSQNIEVQTVLQESSEYRYVAKYCDEYLDKNMKPTEDASKFVYRHCVSSDSYTYTAVFRFAASTSGTMELQGLNLPVKVKITHDLIVKADASYNPEENEIIKFNKSKKITCN